MANKIAKVELLGDFLRKGEFEKLFNLVGVINQSDPAQIYLKEAEKISLEDCATLGKGCKIFARGSEIVWEWDKLPNYHLGGRNMVSWKEVKIMIGTGPIEFGRDTKVAFDDYVDAVKNLKDSKHYFAVSKDGLSYGMQFGEISESKLKKMAIAECMTLSEAQCYLYAEDDNILWTK